MIRAALCLLASTLVCPAPPAPLPGPRPSATRARASWYGSPCHYGRTMANGARFSPLLLVAAHRTLPLGSVLEVQHQSRSVVVTITDRGPWVSGRDLDLSAGAAEILGIKEQGLATVTFTRIR